MHYQIRRWGYSIKNSNKSFILLTYYLPTIAKTFRTSMERKCFWAHSYHLRLPTYGNNMNNYVERSFGILKDIVFARTQAFNSVQ
ncbi:8064_t:CDS:1, partial [Racocetra persica]